MGEKQGHTPSRIRLSRAKGWRMPKNTRKVDRTTRWGNPFPVGAEGPLGRVAPDAEGAVGFFQAMLRDPELRAAASYPSDAEIERELSGKDLACWCAGPFCHADELLKIANRPGATGEDSPANEGEGEAASNLGEQP